MPHETPSSAASVVVLGSLNADTVFAVDRNPGPGETVLSSSVWRGLGGKGANQAVASAKAGATTRIVGCVGTDDDGDGLLKTLGGLSVDTSDMQRSPQAATGAAFIVVDSEGENRIVVDMGANGRLTEEHARDAVDRMTKNEVLVVQTEIPQSIVLAALAEAHARGIRTVLNLAPVIGVGSAVRTADPLVVNAVELSQLMGSSYASAEEVLGRAREVASLAVSVVVTLGSDGAVIIAGDSVEHVPATRVDEVVDTTGAGDAFVGVLAARIAAGDDLVDAAEVASAYAADVVQVMGAADAYPAYTGAGRTTVGEAR